MNQNYQVQDSQHTVPQTLNQSAFTASSLPQPPQSIHCGAPDQIYEEQQTFQGDASRHLNIMDHEAECEEGREIWAENKENLVPQTRIDSSCPQYRNPIIPYTNSYKVARDIQRCGSSMTDDDNSSSCVQNSNFRQGFGSQGYAKEEGGVAATGSMDYIDKFDIHQCNPHYQHLPPTGSHAPVGSNLPKHNPNTFDSIHLEPQHLTHSFFHIDLSKRTSTCTYGGQVKSSAKFRAEPALSMSSPKESLLAGGADDMSPAGDRQCQVAEGVDGRLAQQEVEVVRERSRVGSQTSEELRGIYRRDAYYLECMKRMEGGVKAAERQDKVVRDYTPNGHIKGNFDGKNKDKEDQLIDMRTHDQTDLLSKLHDQSRRQFNQSYDTRNHLKNGSLVYKQFSGVDSGKQVDESKMYRNTHDCKRMQEMTQVSAHQHSQIGSTGIQHSNLSSFNPQIISTSPWDHISAVSTSANKNVVARALSSSEVTSQSKSVVAPLGGKDSVITSSRNLTVRECEIGMTGEVSLPQKQQFEFKSRFAQTYNPTAISTVLKTEVGKTNEQINRGRRGYKRPEGHQSYIGEQLINNFVPRENGPLLESRTIEIEQSSSGVLGGYCAPQMVSGSWSPNRGLPSIKTGQYAHAALPQHSTHLSTHQGHQFQNLAEPTLLSTSNHQINYSISPTTSYPNKTKQSSHKDGEKMLQDQVFSFTNTRREVSDYQPESISIEQPHRDQQDRTAWPDPQVPPQDTLEASNRIPSDNFSVNDYFEQTQNALIKYRNAAAIYKETQKKLDEIAAFENIVTKIERIKNQHSISIKEQKLYSNQQSTRQQSHRLSKSQSVRAVLENDDFVSEGKQHQHISEKENSQSQNNGSTTKFPVIPRKKFVIELRSKSGSGLGERRNQSQFGCERQEGRDAGGVQDAVAVSDVKQMTINQTSSQTNVLKINTQDAAVSLNEPRRLPSTTSNPYKRSQASITGLSCQNISENKTSHKAIGISDFNNHCQTQDLKSIYRDTFTNSVKYHQNDDNAETCSAAALTEQGSQNRKAETSVTQKFRDCEPRLPVTEFLPVPSKTPPVAGSKDISVNKSAEYLPKEEVHARKILEEGDSMKLVWEPPEKSSSQSIVVPHIINQTFCSTSQQNLPHPSEKDRNAITFVEKKEEFAMRDRTHREEQAGRNEMVFQGGLPNKLASSYPQILQEQNLSDMNDCFIISATTYQNQQLQGNTKSLHLTTMTEDKSKESLPRQDKSFRGSVKSGALNDPSTSIQNNILKNTQIAIQSEEVTLEHTNNFSDSGFGIMLNQVLALASQNQLLQVGDPNLQQSLSDIGVPISHSNLMLNLMGTFYNQMCQQNTLKTQKFKKKLKKYKSSYQEMKGQSDNLLEQIASLQARISQRDREQKESEEVQEAVEAKVNQELQRIENEIDVIRTNYEQQLKESKRENQDKVLRMTEKDNKISSLENSLGHQRNEKERLEQELQQQQSLIKELQDQVASHLQKSQQNQTEIQENKDKRKEKYKKVKKELKKVTEEKCHVLGKLSQLDKQCKQQQDLIKSLQSQILRGKQEFRSNQNRNQGFRQQQQQMSIQTCQESSLDYVDKSQEIGSSLQQNISEINRGMRSLETPCYQSIETQDQHLDKKDVPPKNDYEKGQAQQSATQKKSSPNESEGIMSQKITSRQPNPRGNSLQYQSIQLPQISQQESGNMRSVNESTQKPDISSSRFQTQRALGTVQTITVHDLTVGNSSGVAEFGKGLSSQMKNNINDTDREAVQRNSQNSQKQIQSFRAQDPGILQIRNPNPDAALSISEFQTRETNLNSQIPPKIEKPDSNDAVPCPITEISQLHSRDQMGEEDSKFLRSCEISSIEQTKYLGQPMQNCEDDLLFCHGQMQKSTDCQNSPPQIVLQNISVLDQQIHQAQIVVDKQEFCQKMEERGPSKLQKKTSSTNAVKKKPQSKDQGDSGYWEQYQAEVKQEQGITQGFIDMYFTQQEKEHLSKIGGISPNLDDKTNLVKLYKLPGELQRKVVDLFDRMRTERVCQQWKKQEGDRAVQAAKEGKRKGQGTDRRDGVEAGQENQKEQKVQKEVNQIVPIPTESDCGLSIGLSEYVEVDKAVSYREQQPFIHNYNECKEETVDPKVIEKPVENPLEKILPKIFDYKGSVLNKISRKTNSLIIDEIKNRERQESCEQENSKLLETLSATKVKEQGNIMKIKEQLNGSGHLSGFDPEEVNQMQLLNQVKQAYRNATLRDGGVNTPNDQSNQDIAVTQTPQQKDNADPRKGNLSPLSDSVACSPIESQATYLVEQPQVIQKEIQHIPFKKMQDLPWYPKRLSQKQEKIVEDDKKQANVEVKKEEVPQEEAQDDLEDQEEQKKDNTMKHPAQAEHQHFTKKYLQITQTILSQPKQDYFNRLQSMPFGIYRNSQGKSSWQQPQKRHKSASSTSNTQKPQIPENFTVANFAKMIPKQQSSLLQLYGKR